jgi:acetolactate decarboxylase
MAVVIWQNAPAMALEVGCFDGITPAEELAEHGNLGVGAFDQLDGEMVGVDGVFHQVLADSRAAPAPPGASLAFCMVVDYTGGDPLPLPPDTTQHTLPAVLDGHGVSPNLVYTLRIDGTFADLRTRCVRPQSRPYPPLAEATRTQTEFAYDRIAGTMVGFRTPAYVGHIMPPGHHLHFLSADRTVGGHVLSFGGVDGTVTVEHVDRHDICYPDTGDFPHTVVPG